MLRSLCLVLAAMVLLAAASPAAAVPQSQDFCAICTLVFTYVESALAQPASVSEVEAVLDGLCNVLGNGTVLQAECVHVINAEYPEIVSWVVANEPPATICAQLRTCSSAAPAAAPAPAAAKNSVTCDGCEFVMQLLEGFIGKNSTESEILYYVENVCKVVPATYQTLCTNLIATYGDEIINIILSEAPPATVCGVLDLCPTAAAAVVAAPQGDECGVCEFVVGAAETYLSNNRTEAALETFIQNLCQVLPASESSLCSIMVGKFLPELVNYALQTFPPDTACTDLGLCSAEFVPVPLKALTAADGLLKKMVVAA